MSKLCPLFSGSSGNSIYIGHSGNGILIDAGRSAKQLEKILIENDINLKSIKAIFVTHEHNDHISALRVFASRYKIKVYSSAGTISALEKMGIINGTFLYEIIDSKGIELNNMCITPFPTSHDCSEGFGYTVELSNGLKVAVCTDLGFISDTVKNALNGCNILTIESNHDINMLESAPYPYFLKKRILSEKGHLSNDACSCFLPNLVKSGLSRIVLSHLSSENNSPTQAFNCAIKSLKAHGMEIDKDYTLFVAPKSNLGEYKVLF